jgi:glycerol-3-phosphate dehydrogenase (NAD(P)+)
VVLTGRDEGWLRRTADLISTPYYHVLACDDMVGVEVCVALKNLYALAVGLAGGLLELSPPTENEARMHNPAAALFAQSLSEMTYLVTRWGGRASTVISLAGAGDLYVTCQGGRNVRMGRYVGMGLSYGEAMTRFMANETVEGAQLALDIGPTVEAIISRGELSAEALPLFRAIIAMICRGAPARIPWGEFFAA